MILLKGKKKQLDKQKPIKQKKQKSKIQMKLNKMIKKIYALSLMVLQKTASLNPL